MKRTSLIFILSILCFDCFAQVSVGFRGGASYWFSFSGNKTSAIYQGYEVPELRWNKELFSRYNYKRFAFEISFNHDKQTARWYEPVFSYMQTYPRDERVSYYGTTNSFIISSTIQYNAGTWGKKKQWKNYVGISLSQVYQRYRTEGVVTRTDGSYYELPKSTGQNTEIWPGISQSLTWNVNEHLLLNTMLFFRYNTYDGFTPATLNMNNNSQVGLGIGASYKL